MLLITLLTDNQLYNHASIKIVRLRSCLFFDIPEDPNPDSLTRSYSSLMSLLRHLRALGQDLFVTIQIDIYKSHLFNAMLSLVGGQEPCWSV